MDSDTKKLLDEILSTVKRIESRISDVSPESISEGAVHRSPGGKSLSLKEFIINCQPANGVQMTLAVGYYLETHSQTNPFNAADLEAAFRTAREPVPANINDKANMCVKNGFFMEEREKKNNLKAWVVTRTGEETVRAGFGKKNR